MSHYEGSNSHDTTQAQFGPSNQDEVRNYINTYLDSTLTQGSLPGIKVGSVNTQKLVVPDKAIGFNALKPKPACAAYLGPASPVGNAVWVAVNFTATVFDPLNMVNLTGGGGGSSLFTIPVDGRYQLYCSVVWATNGTGIRSISICNNGQAGIAGQAYVDNRILPNASFDHTHQAIAIRQLSAGTKLQVAIFQNSGASLNVTPAVQDLPIYFSIEYLSSMGAP